MDRVQKNPNANEQDDDDDQADPATLLEVDTIILDHLVYKATRAVLDERRGLQSTRTRMIPDTSKADKPLDMVDGESRLLGGQRKRWATGSSDLHPQPS